MQSNSPFYTHARNIGLALCKRIPPLRRLRYLYWNRQADRYNKLSKTTQTQPSMVVFEAFGGRKYACSPKAIYQYMCADERFSAWDFIWVEHKDFPNMHVNEPELERATIVVRGSEEYFKAMAQAKYWVVNNRVPEYVSPKRDQVYIQCWHGTPLKRLGYDVPETTSGGALNTARELADRFKLDADKWAYLVSPSPYTSTHLCDAFGLAQDRRKGVVLQVGYPRNDSVVNTVNAPNAEYAIAEMKKEYGIPAGKKVLLFAPTWRDDQYTEGVGYTLDSIVDFGVLQEALGGEWVILLRTHYYIANKFDLAPWKDFVINVSDVNDINNLYCVSDALCTDYSSVFFDYAVTGRPLYFYWPDRQHYENDLHGFYLDVDTLPGPKCETAEELAEALKDFSSWTVNFGDSYETFRATYCPLEDGRASERVVEGALQAGQGHG